ncbi:DNA polymerase zeta catalytic subunit-like isoform X1 [Stylophora pistillata]|uniref:DNA polymerase zeta catalytic subunit-like isoform X1 n=1 Tax=Stylophora pistillata TaxID=50429 RepID=UPI000C04A64B|nr:DNA polymerase zeta catalytic subunit-like isoform X1 [Stylophora pistillata]
MVNILASLAEEPRQPCASQKAQLSQSIILDQDVLCNEEGNEDEELSESEESILMSQKVWDDIEVALSEVENVDDQGDAHVNDSQSVRPSQYDMEGMTDTWIGSFLGENIPQLDGAADEESYGKEDFKIQRGKPKKVKTKTSLNVDDKVSRDVSQTSTLNLRSSGENVKEEKNETSGEFYSVDVWPKKGLAVRTYSRKSMSVPKNRKTPSLNVEMVAVNSDEEKQQEKCGDEFKLFLSDSSDSESETFKERNVGSKQNEVNVYPQTRQIPEELKTSRSETSTTRNSTGTSSESCTPVITKYFHSPVKNPERTKRTDWFHPHSEGKSLTPSEQSGEEVVPHYSKQQKLDLRKSSFRKRKLTEVDRNEEKLFRGIVTRRTSKNLDVLASLGVVSDAMKDLTVSLQDISHQKILSSKLNEAKQRLRKRNESYTFIRERLKSPNREQKLLVERSPQLSKNEKSPLSRKKNSSPRRKEERAKRFGSIPIVIEKSPKKNQVPVNNLVPDTNRLLTETSSPNLSSAQILGRQDCDGSDPNLNCGMGRASFPNRAQVLRLLSSQSTTSTSSVGSIQTSRIPSVSSRALTLKSDSKLRGKSHNEPGNVLSLRKGGLKRKLMMDTGEKQMKAKPRIDTCGIGKKRKLSLTLIKADKTCLDEKKDCDKETLVTSAENCSVKDCESVCETDDFIGKIQLDTEDNATFSRSEAKVKLSSNTGVLEDITCIPSSPVDSDSNDDSVNNSDSSATSAELKPLSLPASSYGRVNDSGDSSVSNENQREAFDNVCDNLNGPQLLSQELFPKERDTELLANALFNMSFPSPLPSRRCCSPPCPSSPSDANRHSNQLGSEGKMVEQQFFVAANSRIVNEDGDSVLRKGGMSTSSLSPVNRTDHCSLADGHPRAKFSLLETGPRLGETQTSFESTSMLYNDAEACGHVENSYNRLKGVDGNLKMVGESWKSHVNNSKPKAKDEQSSMEGNVTGREKDCTFNLGSTVSEEKPFDSSSNRVTKSNASVADTRGPETERTPLQRECIPESAEAREADFEQGELVLRMNVAGNSSTHIQLVQQCNLQNEEMEICVQGDSRDRTVCTGNSLNCRLAAGLHAKPDRIYKSSISGANAPQNDSLSLESSKSDSFQSKNVIAFEPLKRPPTSEELLNSLKDYGLPQCRYQQPFCSDPDDVPSCPREVGGRILRIESKKVSSLPEFESAGSLQGLKHWKFVLSSALEVSLYDLGQTVEDATDFKKNVELRISLVGDGDVVVTPCRGPPTPQAVKAWARDKLAKRRQGTSLKKAKREQGTSKDENLEKVETKQSSNPTKIIAEVSKTSKLELNQAIPESSLPKIPSEKITCESGALVLEDLPKHKVLDGVDGDKKTNVVDLSDSSSPAEVVSPGSLFSSNEEKLFTLASSFKQSEKHNLGEISGTQPISINSSLGLAVPDEQLHQANSVTTETNSPPSTVMQSKAATPPARISSKGSPQLSPLTIKQVLSPTLQTQDSPAAAPHHSTPVATNLVYGLRSPRCTPISAATNAKSPETNAQNPVKGNTGHQASTDQTPLRQQMLASRFKFVTPGSKPRCHLPWSSQIEGPSPNNTYGFKVTQINLRDAKALHEVQHLTLFSLELHVRTRRDMRPDPEFDRICAVFYYIQTDTPLPSGKNKVTGIICVDPESAKICGFTTENKDTGISNTDITTPVAPSNDTVVSTSSRATQNTRAAYSRPLLSRSGIAHHDIQYVAEEKDLFPALIKIIRKWDPDILIGYEIQMFSWGFLLERALFFEIDFCSWLSRVKGSSSDSNMDAEKDNWGAAHTSEFKIAGRIILNVWRLMRHEAALNSYSFENVAFHVLHERIPLYSFRTLSDWWDQRTSLNRWRTVDHYVLRCRGNVRILESVDFIGRTSELARLFGILFFSVISRGSQYRVESMMLRIAKPMNYIAVSPSVEQRGLMRAPETIPLVMEPESRFYSDPVLVLDFQSLYPSVVIAYNYCFSTCLGRVSCLSEYGEFKFGATSLRVPPSLLKKLEGDIHVSPSGVAFVKSNIRRGILPSMLEEILETRIMVKASMKKWKSDKSLGRMLDARQLGLKLIANVTFGYTSAHFSGRMPCVEIGDSIVRKARETLERAIDLVNNTPRWGARVVYGDTDSLFVLLKGATKKQAFIIGKDIVDTVTAMNPKPVKLKFEKVYLPCVLQTKKRYVGYMYETLDQKEPAFDAKGIETVRRDSIPAVAKILEKSLRILFETRDLSLIKKYVQRQCTKLMEGRASLQDFTFAKEYRGMKNYKPGACVPALELTRRMLKVDRRSEPRVAERVPYVVVYGSPGLPLIQLVRRPQEVLQDPSLRLNASYYITKQILPPLNRVFSLIGLDVFTWYAELPRVVRVAQIPSDPGERKKGTISQYFSTMACPVCQDLTPTDLCAKCRGMPRRSAVILITRMRGWERTYHHLAEICYGCSGSRDTKLRCVSLDCPVFYKLVQCTRDLKSSEHHRKVLDSL